MAAKSSNSRKNKKMPVAKQQAILTKIAENPFEKRNVNKKKHEVFNRRVKGEGRNVARARNDAINRREKTLLIDYKQSKKANAFEDRRFGETDSRMSLEEKMWARMQKEKTRTSHSGRKSAFILDDDYGDEELLTHKGQSLKGNFEKEIHNDTNFNEDADDGGLNKEIVERLHFGGGNKNEGSNFGNKSRKEIMEEIIAKSKMRKAEKFKVKEQQEDAIQELDAGFQDVMGLLEQRPTRQSGEKVRPSMDDYDRITKELIFESKAHATDRIKTPEEIALAEKEKLERLEHDRLRRMREEGTEHRGKKGDKTRHRNDDELGDDFEVNNDSKGNNSPLSESNSNSSASDSEDGSEYDSEEDEHNSEQDIPDDNVILDKKEVNRDMNMDNYSSKNSESDLEEGESDSVEGESDLVEGESDLEEGESGSIEDEYNLLSSEYESNKKSKKVDIPDIIASVTKEEIPYILPCPSSMESFLELLTKYASTAEDINTIVERIVKNHNVKLDKRNAEKMHNFYEVLLKRFQHLGDQVASMKGGPMNRELQLEFLVKILHGMTQDMPSAAGALWHKLIGDMQRRLDKELRDRSEGQNLMIAPCWPSPGHRLLMKLLGDLFPITDFRHPVTTPAALLLGQYLSQCPVENSSELSAGIFLSAIMIHQTASARRVPPEALSFLSGVIAQYSKFSPIAKNSQKLENNFRINPLIAEHISTPSLINTAFHWLRPTASEFYEENFEKFPSLSVTSGWLDNDEVQAEHRSVFSVSALSCVYSVVRLVVKALHECPGFPELILPLQEILSRVRPMDEPALPVALQELHLALQEEIDAALKTSLSIRTPLRWLLGGVKSVKALAPKFLENYNFAKDSGLDRDSANLKQLKRQVKREKKGAIRELKLDAAYLEGVKARERNDKDMERKKALRANRTWLEEEQATWNQQVSSKSTRKLISGGGSSIKKRPKIGRGY